MNHQPLMEHRLDRRQFLKTAGAIATGSTSLEYCGVGPQSNGRRTVSVAAGLCALVLTAMVGAAEKADIELADGRVLKAARIVTIGEKVVTVAHEGGVITVPPDSIPLDVLARAHIEISDGADAKKTSDARVVARDAERQAESKLKKEEEVQVRLAEATARAKTKESGEVEGARRPAVDSEKRLIALKGRFPAKQSVKVAGAKSKVQKRKKNQNKGSHTLEIEVPHVDVCRYYHGMFQTTTVASLPRTIAQVETRVQQDIAVWTKKRDSDDGVKSQLGTHTQAGRTVEWLKRDLRAFIEEARRLGNGK